jgi:DNA processing protein
VKNFTKIIHKRHLWLSVIRNKGLGAKTFWRLLEDDPSLMHAKTSNVETEIKSHEEMGYEFIAAFEDVYPISLKNLDDAPPIISFCGNIELLNKPIIGIVGARNASPGGLRLAHTIARELGEAGFIIVSGLARGIDGAAHNGSLDTGTIAVIAGGIDQIYPPENTKLYHDIKTKGCLISEMPFGAPPAAPLFPRRNRLIASLCQGLVIIEAAKKSGTLITAEYAANLGRDVFVIPGSPLDPRSLGGNGLIKQGAILIESARDILQHYEWQYTPQLSPSLLKTNQINHETPQLPQWLSTLGTEGMILDDVVTVWMKEQPTLTTAQIMAALASLEMDGKIIRTPGGQIQKVF